MNFRSRLLSRKRKLSELFSITAYQLALDEPNYKQQLQAFHDANDLERYVSHVASVPWSFTCYDTLLRHGLTTLLTVVQRSIVRRVHSPISITHSCPTTQNQTLTAVSLYITAWRWPPSTIKHCKIRRVAVSCTDSFDQVTITQPSNAFASNHRRTT